MSYSYALLLDSGAYMGSYSSKARARARLALHNSIARAQKAAGELVSLRLAVGIVRIDGDKVRAAARARLEAARRPRKRKAA